MSPGSNSSSDRVVSSALWAAWGDALGFITELTTSVSEVSRRSGSAKVENTVPWSRRIGGRFGPMVKLPAGTYSDDTQLRLAVSRSIRATGRFDLEAFSKIELPVFLSYEMRAGRGTKAAAYELMKRHVRWSTNFFDNQRSKYTDGGGNGAAMRIQPHVWSAAGFNPKHFIGWVTADAITTHGHPRGVVGAVVHANALSSALRHGEVPSPSRWPQIIDYAKSIPEVMESHELLRERWIPMWEEATDRRWGEAVHEAIREGQEMFAIASEVADAEDPVSAYGEVITRLGGKKRETVGSGMIAAVTSLLAAWLFRDDAVAGLQTIANELGSDTDTIATMAGALLGATGQAHPPGPILDEAYIVSEARRMAAIAEGKDAVSFPHPDPLRWKPPRTLADSVGTREDGGLAVAGLGPVVQTGEEYATDGKDAAVFQWLTLAYGQTVLIKRRPEPQRLPASTSPVERPARQNGGGQVALFDLRADESREEQPARESRGGSDDVAVALERVIQSGFDPQVIGDELLRLSGTREQSVERASAFAAGLAAIYRTKRADRS